MLEYRERMTRRRADEEDEEPLDTLLDRLVSEAISLGASSEQISAALERATNESAETVVAELRRIGPKMLREHAKIRKGFEKRLRKRWARALDLYECVYTACFEAGEQFNNEQRPRAAADNDVRFEALTLLHVRACLVTSDIHALLRTGHASGAQARWRTLHEIAVIAFVLGANDAEISERFLLHRLVERYKDALHYQQHCEALGYEPFSDDEMTEFRETKETVVTRFGSGYQKPWGWAKPLLQPNQTPNFTLLEPLAGIEHLRPWVHLSHHTIHGGATGALQVKEMYGRGGVMLAGPSSFDLADPAQSTLASLYQITAAYLLHGDPDGPSQEKFISLKAIEILLNDAQEAFVDIQTAIDADEEVAEAD